MSSYNFDVIYPTPVQLCSQFDLVSQDKHTVFQSLWPRVTSWSNAVLDIALRKFPTIEKPDEWGMACTDANSGLTRPKTLQGPGWGEKRRDSNGQNIGDEKDYIDRWEWYPEGPKKWPDDTGLVLRVQYSNFSRLLAGGRMLGELYSVCLVAIQRGGRELMGYQGR